MGYGIRYEYGMFRQKIENGQQVERPDALAGKRCTLGIYASIKTVYRIDFGGHIYFEGKKCIWQDPAEKVTALAYDQMIPGYRNMTQHATLRLWSAHAGEVFNLSRFQPWRTFSCISKSILRIKTLSRVLYPDDSTWNGRELRLRQEYFLVSASLQDILRRHLSTHIGTLNNLS